jgi:hypothetical protein
MTYLKWLLILGFKVFIIVLIIILTVVLLLIIQNLHLAAGSSKEICYFI